MATDRLYTQLNSAYDGSVGAWVKILTRVTNNPSWLETGGTARETTVLNKGDVNQKENKSVGGVIESDHKFGVSEANDIELYDVGLSGITDPWVSGYTLEEKEITAIVGTPAIVTIASHGFKTGQKVLAEGVSDSTQWNDLLANKIYVVEVIDINTFYIKDSLLTLLLESKYKGRRVYVSEYEYKSASYTAENQTFSGQVNANHESKALKYDRDSQFATETHRLCEYKFVASPYFEDVFSQYKLKDLIHGNDDENVTGIDETWESENVFHAAAWYDGARLFNGWQSTIPNMVNLGHIVRKLADNIEQSLLNNDQGVWVVIIEGFKYKYPFHPARWSVTNGRPFLGNHNPYYPNLPNPIFHILESDATDLYFEPDDKPSNYSVVTDHYLPTGLNIPYPANTDTVDYFKRSMWVNYTPIKILDDYLGSENKINRTDIEPFQWEKIDNFIDLMKILAVGLGTSCNIQTEYPNILRISFDETAAESGNQVFLKSVIEDTEKVSSEDQDEKKMYFGSSFSHANEGNSLYTDGVKEVKGAAPVGELYKIPENAERLLFTVSPTVTIANYTKSKFGVDTKNGYLPHCTIPDTATDKTAKGFYRNYNWDFTTAIFMFVENNTDIDELNNYCNDYFWTQAAAINLTAANNGELLYSDKLSGIINTEQGIFYKDGVNLLGMERSLTMPNWFGVTDQSDGTDLDSKHLKIRKILPWDNKLYKIKEIAKSRNKLQTKIKLRLLEDIDFRYVEVDKEAFIESDVNIDPDGGSIISATASSVIAKGSFVSKKSDGSIEITQSKMSHQQRIIGVALNDVADGGIVLYKETGRVYNDDWDFTDKIGQRLYIRFDADLVNTSDFNLSLEPLSIPEGNEDLFADVAQIIAKNGFLIQMREISSY
jgi:hypothetical protein